MGRKAGERMERKNIFPGIVGNDALCERLARDITSGAGLAHAYIIEGKPGSGRRTLARNIAAAISCERRGSGAPLPCGECPACRKIFAGISPDVITVSREDGKASIGIDTVRALRTDVHVLPNELDSKIYIIEDADTMTVQAQNALLLTLEEPPAYLVFLLIAENSRNMLETVRSRAPALRMQPLTADAIASIAAKHSADAAKLRTEDEAAFRGVIMAADGSAGRAIELFGGKEKDAVTARRTAAESFCRLASSSGNGGALTAAMTPYSSGKRDEALRLLDDISLALRDLALKKKSENVSLRFFSDRDTAEELCGAYTLSRLVLLYDATEKCRALLAQNANTRLTLFNLINTASESRRNKR